MLSPVFFQVADRFSCNFNREIDRVDLSGEYMDPYDFTFASVALDKGCLIVLYVYFIADSQSLVLDYCIQGWSSATISQSKSQLKTAFVINPTEVSANFRIDGQPWSLISYICVSADNIRVPGSGLGRSSGDGRVRLINGCLRSLSGGSGMNQSSPDQKDSQGSEQQLNQGRPRHPSCAAMSRQSLVCSSSGESHWPCAASASAGGVPTGVPTFNFPPAGGLPGARCCSLAPGSPLWALVSRLAAD